MDTTVYTNGAFHTLDGALGTVDALAVRGARILAAGSHDECLAAAGAGPAIVDLGGAAVVPGLADCHIHTAEYARSLVSVDLRGTASLQQALALVRDHAGAVHGAVGGAIHGTVGGTAGGAVASTVAGTVAGTGGASGPPWVLGGHWDSNRWEVPVRPNRRDLDAAVPDRPVALRSIDSHTFWLNSVALQRVGIDRATADPPGGEIVRDADGEPTGILRETAAALVDAALPPDAALPQLVRGALDRLLSHGVTSIHDIDGADALNAFETLRAAGDLPVRVHKMIRLPDLAAAVESGRATGDGDSWLRTGPLKLFTDGALGSHSCLMSRGFADDPGNHGISVTAYPELLALIRTAARSGIAVAAHAIGDAANHLLLDAFSEVIAGAGAASEHAGLRYRIEHAQFLQRSDIARLAPLGVVASMQPTHCTSDIALVERMLARRDLARYPWRSLLESGAVVAFGSDAPTEDPNPWLGVHAAVTRQRADGTPPGGWDPAERLTLAQALHAYTVAAAYASGEEHLKGRLRPGMLADFAVLADDPFALPPSELHGLAVTATVVGGRIRWSG